MEENHPIHFEFCLFITIKLIVYLRYFAVCATVWLNCGYTAMFSSICRSTCQCWRTCKLSHFLQTDLGACPISSTVWPAWMNCGYNKIHLARFRRVFGCAKYLYSCTIWQALRWCSIQGASSDVCWCFVNHDSSEIIPVYIYIYTYCNENLNNPRDGLLHMSACHCHQCSFHFSSLMLSSKRGCILFVENCVHALNKWNTNFLFQHQCQGHWQHDVNYIFQGNNFWNLKRRRTTRSSSEAATSSAGSGAKRVIVLLCIYSLLRGFILRA